MTHISGLGEIESAIDQRHKKNSPDEDFLDTGEKQQRRAPRRGASSERRQQYLRITEVALR